MVGSAVDREASGVKDAADALTRSGRFHDAVPLYSQALQLAQEPQLRSTLLANRCLALLRTGQPVDALADALRSLELRPRWAKAHLRVAQCQEALGDAPAAVASYRRSLELEPALGEAVGRALAALEVRASRDACRLALPGHPAAVYGLALHPQVATLGCLSTRLLATACGDGAVRVWCSSVGTLLQTLTGHTDRVTTVEWSLCGRFLASGSLDGTARLWELSPALSQQAQQAQHAQQGGHRPPAQQQGSAGAVAPLMQPKALLEGHTGRVSSLAFGRAPLRAPQVASPGVTPGGGEAAGTAGVAEGDSRSSGSSTEGSGGKDGAASSGCCEGGELLLATGSTDCTARLWSVQNGKCLQELRGHGGIITSVSLSPCGRLLATASGDTRCKVWDTATGACVHDIAWESGGVNLCGFMPQQAQERPVAAAGAGAKPAARNSTTCSSGSSSRQGSQQEPGGEGGAPAPPLLLTAHIEPRRREGRILLWDVGAGEELGTPLAPAAAAPSAKAAAQGAAAQQAGNGEVPVNAAGLEQVAEGEEGAKVPPAGGPPPLPSKPAVGKGRQRVGWVDGQLHAPAQTIDGFRGKITSWDACLGPGGTVLLAAACGDGLARVYDVGAGGVHQLFQLSMEDSTHSVAQDMPAWSMASMQQAANSRNQVRFSPCGELLAVSGADCRVAVYDVESSDKVQAMLGHTKSIRALVWSGEREVVSAGEDGAVKVWRVDTVAP